MGNTKEVKSNDAKSKGLKSLAVMVVLVVFLLIAVTAVCLGGLGILFLSQSMRESAQEYEMTKNQGLSDRNQVADTVGHFTGAGFLRQSGRRKHNRRRGSKTGNGGSQDAALQG